MADQYRIYFIALFLARAGGCSSHARALVAGGCDGEAAHAREARAGRVRHWQHDKLLRSEPGFRHVPGSTVPQAAPAGQRAEGRQDSARPRIGGPGRRPGSGRTRTSESRSR
jgi:hypothetical protein